MIGNLDFRHILWITSWKIPYVAWITLRESLVSPGVLRAEVAGGWPDWTQ